MSCIKDWPVADRPREKLLSSGPTSLSDTELLALILRTGENRYQVQALTPIDEFNDEFESEFSDDDYGTIGGGAFEYMAIDHARTFQGFEAGG